MDERSRQGWKCTKVPIIFHCLGGRKPESPGLIKGLGSSRQNTAGSLRKKGGAVGVRKYLLVGKVFKRIKAAEDPKKRPPSVDLSRKRVEKKNRGT